MANKTALVVICDSVEEVELVTTIDLLVRAGIAVTVASIETDRLAHTCTRGVKIVADKHLHECTETYDVICIPGGMPGATTLGACSPLVERLKTQLAEGRWVAAICASPVVVLLNNNITSAPVN